MIDLVAKRVAVVGLGASGVAAARLCLSRGAIVVATDTKSADAVGSEVHSLAREGATLVLGGHADAKLDEADLVVVSPGVPSFPELAAASRKNVRIVGEIELAVQALRTAAPIVAIGGTNGKSTVTSLVGDLLETKGLRVFAGGNLGEPLASHADETFDVIVLEVSSFQMERLETFKPKVSVLLNVTADHLDRYPGLEQYACAKGNAFMRQTEDDLAVVPVSDAACARQAKRGRGRLVTFGRGGDADVTDAHVRFHGESYERARFSLSGGHNALNVAASIAAVSPFGVAPAAIRSVLASFRGLPHRMALVADVRGVRYYDDSKGTNVGATVTALRGLVEKKAVLIAGGRDKLGSYDPLVDALRAKGRAAVVIGEAAPAIAGAIGDTVPVRRAASLDEAVRLASELAQDGDAVLLSPACSSYDMFRDYKHRGDEFVRAVRALQGSEVSR